MIALWQLLLVSRQFKVIDHKFPEVGHTYMDSDRDFGLIGSQVRKTRKGTYTVPMSSYIDLMKNVKKRNKFKVTDISPGFIDGKLISQKLYNANKAAKENR